MKHITSQDKALKLNLLLRPAEKGFLVIITGKVTSVAQWELRAYDLSQLYIRAESRLMALLNPLALVDMRNFQDWSREIALSTFLGSELLEDKFSLCRSPSYGSETLTSRGLGISFMEMYSRINTEDLTQTWALDPMLVYIYLVDIPENNCPMPSPRRRVLRGEWQPVHWSNQAMGRQWLMFSRVQKCMAGTTEQALYSITFSSIYKFGCMPYHTTF